MDSPRATNENYFGGWAAIAVLLVNDDRYRKLCPAEQVFFIYLHLEHDRFMFSHHPRDGKIYRSDLELAAELRLSVPRVRDIREKLRSLKLVQYTNGGKYRDKETGQLKNHATEYTHIEFSLAAFDDKATYGQWFKLYRFTLKWLLDLAGRGKIRHRHIKLWISLNCLFSRNEDGAGIGFTFHPDELLRFGHKDRTFRQELAELCKATENRLFTFTSQHHSIWIQGDLNIHAPGKSAESKELEIMMDQETKRRKQKMYQEIARNQKKWEIKQAARERFGGKPKIPKLSL